MSRPFAAFSQNERLEMSSSHDNSVSGRHNFDVSGSETGEPCEVGSEGHYVWRRGSAATTSVSTNPGCGSESESSDAPPSTRFRHRQEHQGLDHHVVHPDHSSEVSSMSHVGGDVWQSGTGDPAEQDGVEQSAPIASGGSAKHNVGKCKPCAFVNTVVGCMHGAECTFCHLKHGKDVARLGRSKRERYKSLVARQARESGIASADEGTDTGLESDRGAEQKPKKHILSL